jgi:hypothetical protein
LWSPEQAWEDSVQSVKQMRTVRVCGGVTLNWVIFIVVPCILTHWGRVFFSLYLSQIINSEWRHVSSNIWPGGPFAETLHVLCNEVRGNQARVKNADLRHSSFTVVMQKLKKRKFASPVLNVLILSKYFI